MRLKRYAHACFGVEDALGRTWLFDPYRPNALGGRFSLPPIKIKPYRVLCTHNHEDHAWRAEGWGDVPIWETPKETAEASLKVQMSPHDSSDGTRMGLTRSLKLTLKGSASSPSTTWVHLGDVGEGQGEALSNFCHNADVLLIPAGGNFTMGPTEAIDLALNSNARYAVLMHFKEPGIDLDMLTPEEAFAKTDTPIKRLESGILEVAQKKTKIPTRILWLAPTQ